jgi:hypothetical protein
MVVKDCSNCVSLVTTTNIHVSGSHIENMDESGVE